MINDEIELKSSKTGLIIGILFFVFAFGALVTLLSIFAEEDAPIVGRILSCVMVPGMLVFVGCTGIYDYVKNGRRLREAMDKYGEQNIINNIRCNTYAIFQKRSFSDKVYFTDKFVFAPNEALIEYSEINWIYKHVRNNKGRLFVYIAFRLLDGSRHLICRDADDNDIASIVQNCLRYNPNIMVGYSKEMENRYNENVKRFKNGMLPMNYSPITAEEMIRSNNYHNGIGRMALGAMLIGGEIFIAIAMVLASEVKMDGIFPLVLLILMIPGIVAGVIMLVSGYEKKNKYKR